MRSVNMGKNIIEDMKSATLLFTNSFKDDQPVFTIAYFEEKLKMSFLTGYLELKYFFQEIDPNNIIIITRDFDFGRVWTLELDEKPFFILANNKELDQKQLTNILMKIGFSN